MKCQTKENCHNLESVYAALSSDICECLKSIDTVKQKYQLVGKLLKELRSMMLIKIEKLKANEIYFNTIQSKLIGPLKESEKKASDNKFNAIERFFSATEETEKCELLSFALTQIQIVKELNEGLQKMLKDMSNCKQLRKAQSLDSELNRHWISSNRFLENMNNLMVLVSKDVENFICSSKIEGGLRTKLIKDFPEEIAPHLEEVFQLTRNFLFSKKQCDDNKDSGESKEDESKKQRKGIYPPPPRIPHPRPPPPLNLSPTLRPQPPVPHPHI